MTELPPPGYTGIPLGATSVIDGRVYLCVRLERSSHTCARGLVCKAAWNVVWRRAGRRD